MNTILPIINGKPLLTSFEDFELSDAAYDNILAINEVVRVEEDDYGDKYFSTVGTHAHQVLQFSIQPMIERESPELVKHVVDVFSLKSFFAPAFSDMIDAL